MAFFFFIPLKFHNLCMDLMKNYSWKDELLICKHFFWGDQWRMFLIDPFFHSFLGAWYWDWVFVAWCEFWLGNLWCCKYEIDFIKVIIKILTFFWKFFPDFLFKGSSLYCGSELLYTSLCNNFRQKIYYRPLFCRRRNCVTQTLTKYSCHLWGHAYVM